jgi:ferritin-like metal-binding protein YciE
MKMTTLEDLFLDQLRDLFDAEHQLIKALPKMAQAAAAADLRAAFEEHLGQTRRHAERLEQVFEQIGARARAKKCPAMKGLIVEGKELMEEKAEPQVKDAGLIAAAQKVEHYEMAGYGCLVAWAQRLGYRDCVGLLRETLGEEKAADEKLTRLAEGHINREAAQGAGEGDGRTAEGAKEPEAAGAPS